MPEKILNEPVSPAKRERKGDYDLAVIGGGPAGYVGTP